MNPSSSPMLPALSSTLFISLLDSARQLQISDTYTQCTPSQCRLLTIFKYLVAIAALFDLLFHSNLAWGLHGGVDVK
jgi:hypothetical protein